MKMFEPFPKFTPCYPDDFKAIKEYLTSRGKLNIGDKSLENEYRNFSDEVYDASWMSIHGTDGDDNILLYEFAEYLSSKDI